MLPNKKLPTEREDVAFYNFEFTNKCGGTGGTRTRDLCRDRAAL